MLYFVYSRVHSSYCRQLSKSHWGVLKVIVVENGEVIADAFPRHKFGFFEDKPWAMGVYVKPEWRRQGLGKIVSAAATQEVLDLGGLALWNAQADNIGSLSIAKSLGYETVFYQIKMPKYVVEGTTTTVLI